MLFTLTKLRLLTTTSPTERQNILYALQYSHHSFLYYQHAECSLSTVSVNSEPSIQMLKYLRIKDSCITNGDRDEILSVGDHRIEDYVNRTGNKDCVLVDDLIKKMFQASTNKQSQADTDLTQLFMSFAIIQAIKNSGTHQDVNEQALKLWIYVIVTPIEWGKGVTSDALFSVFSGSRFITPSNALVMAAFDTLLRPYLQMESFAERNTLPNSKNILCELSVKKTGDASLSMDIFSVTKLKGPQ